MNRALICTLVIVLFCVSCRDNPVVPGVVPPPTTEPPGGSVAPVGLVEVTLSGVGTSEASATARAVNPSLSVGSGAASFDLVPVPSGPDGGIQLEAVTNGSFTEGIRGRDGHRYMYATFRVRNAAVDGTPYDVPRRNLTFLAVSTTGTLPGTPVSRLHQFDGTPASSALATSIVPTGAVRQDETLAMQSQHADVLQAYLEDDIASMTAPAAVTNVFPYGFVVRNPNTPDGRTLPANPGPNEFDGLVTFAFRVPLQPHDEGSTNGPEKDPFTISVVFLAVEDSVTRVTESVEEQTPEGRTAVAARAAAIGASAVTVLAGSPSSGYPGQRRICTLRTAGEAGSPTTTVTEQGAFSRVEILRPGETMDPCDANFRTGTANRPALGVAYPIMVYALDRYGNVKTMVSDTVKLSSTDLGATMPDNATLQDGEKALSVMYHAYGSSTLTARTSRMRGTLELNVAGVTRTWNGAESNDWHTGANWEDGAVPAALDSVVIPATAPNQPLLASNVAIGGVTLENGASLDLDSYDLTATANVWTGTSGGITGATGRLNLVGSAKTVAGVVPRLRVTGTYSLVGNLAIRAPLTVENGRITDASYRITITSN